MATIYERIATSVAVNRVAAQVTQASGEEPRVTAPIPNHWSERPALRRLLPSDENLTGHKFGRFTVIGLLAGSAGSRSGGALWVCRCACSAFEARRGRTIKSGRNRDDCCGECYELVKLKDREFRRRTGLDGEKRP